MTMGNLWQFFGLPDPDAGGVARVADTPTSTQNRQLSNEPVAVETQVVEETPARHIDRSTTLEWSGPVTPDGEPFHDLSHHGGRVLIRPTRALRYVKPDEKHRIHTRDIAQRVLQGDTIIVDLRTLVHMESHQQACRRELRVMCEQVGVGVFALDSEDKLLMIPGADVVVDIEKHELGLTRLLSVS